MLILIIVVSFFIDVDINCFNTFMYKISKYVPKSAGTKVAIKEANEKFILFSFRGSWGFTIN